MTSIPSFMKRAREGVTAFDLEDPKRLNRQSDSNRLLAVDEEQFMRDITEGRDSPYAPAYSQPVYSREQTAEPSIEHAGPFADHVKQMTDKILTEADTVALILERRAADIRQCARNHVDYILSRAIDAATAIRDCTTLVESSADVHKNLVGQLKKITIAKEEEAAAAEAQATAQEEPTP